MVLMAVILSAIALVNVCLDIIDEMRDYEKKRKGKDRG
jgi:hypothetical protein